MTRELFEGRRVPWVSPLRLYLLFSVAYFFVISLGGSQLRVTITSDSDQDTTAAIQSRGFRNEAEMRQALAEAQATWLPRLNFVLVPFFAWLVSRARRASGRRYPQHLLFALHAHAAWFGIRALSDGIALVAPASMKSTLNAASSFYGIVYVAIAIRVAYDIATRRAIRDALIVLGIYWISVVAATLGVLLPAFFWHKA